VAPERLGEFEAYLRRQRPAGGPPADLKTRILSQAAVGAVEPHRRAAGPWAALAAVVAVAMAAVGSEWIEAGGSVAAGPGPAMVLVDVAPPGSSPLVMLQARGPVPLDIKGIRKQHRLLEALIGS
jgi:hypothetical protein